MRTTMLVFCVSMLIGILGGPSNAQQVIPAAQQDTTRQQNRMQDVREPQQILTGRDDIGDLNSAAIQKGEFPGAILLPGTQVSVAIGGFIKATALYDSRYSLKEEIVRPGSFSSNDFLGGQFYVGARSSRLFFDGRATVDDLRARGYIEMDYRGSPGITLRHIYLKIEGNGGKSLLMGQYWSNAMDLRTIPEGLVEPTMSGGTFSRHGQLRVTSPMGDAATFAVSVEDPNNSDIRGENVTPLNKYPDAVATVSIDPSRAVHCSIMGLYREMSALQGGRELRESGFLTSLSAVLAPNPKHKIAASALYGKGASNYIMGADATAGYVSDGEMELQKQFGGFVAYRYAWSDNFRSNIAFGRFEADQLDGNPGAHLKSSTYGFVNALYRLSRYVNIGVEWIYAEKEEHGGQTRVNNRFEFGMQVF